jgi:hypothetical protein
MISTNLGASGIHADKHTHALCPVRLLAERRNLIVQQLPQTHQRIAKFLRNPAIEI